MNTKKPDNPAVTKAPPPIVPGKGSGGGSAATPKPEPAPLNPAAFAEWVTRDAWTLHEAAHILHGYQPVNHKDFEPKDRENAPRESDRWKVADMYDRIKSAILTGKLAYSPGLPHPVTGEQQFRLHRVEPLALVKWARGKAFDIPAELNAISEEPKTLTQTRERTLLRTIGALLQVVDGRLGCNPHPDFASQAKLIQHLTAKLDDMRGFRVRSLEGVFAEANQALNEDD